LKKRLLLSILLVAGLLGGAILYLRSEFGFVFGDTSNFQILYPRPKLWEAVPHTPFALFLFEHKGTRSQLRGAQNQIVSDVNPTPEMDTNGIADYYVWTTEHNQPTWKATRLPDLRTANERFSTIKRVRKDKIVVTAFTVRGNTTAIFSLSISEPHLNRYDELFKEFTSFLGDVRLVPEREQAE